MRSKPNFLVTGTPGVGKTTFSGMLAERFGFLHIPISRLIADKHLWHEKDEQRDCTIYDEQLLDEEIQRILKENPNGGVVFDFHCTDIVPKDAIDYVIVLKCTSDILYKRLVERGYSQSKITENVEAEIFRVILDEVIDDFDENKIIEIQSDQMADLDLALDKIAQLLSVSQ
ncbi:factor activating pos9 [Tritrichomonas musculus]|uniref:Adenylate kinase isoenzyme 6 homolog n=1 Tax=Tritrichomonas musculus TaxID=1915356 RepID=A0ABR2KV94_9EUKA